jgi:hypothetical protein
VLTTKGQIKLRLRVNLRALFHELLRLGFDGFHLPDGCAEVGRAVRRGNVFASRMSCPTFRIFSANGSRASFCRISSFISLAASAYAIAGLFPTAFYPARIAMVDDYQIHAFA